MDTTTDNVVSAENVVAAPVTEGTADVSPPAKKKAKRSKPGSLSMQVRKVFWNAKPGDRIAFVTMLGEGGLYTVKSREAGRGANATTVLHVERVSSDGKVFEQSLDLRVHGSRMAVIAIVRDKRRGRPPANKETVEAKEESNSDAAAA